MQKNQQQVAAKAFAERWAGKGYEKGESQPFWMELIQTVLGVERPYDIISFENQVKLSSTSFIDAYIEPTHTLIEQKSIDKDLRKAIPQSDGSLLKPFEQAKRYNNELPYSKRARWVVICNFKEFHVYDMENPHSEPEVILLENLETEYYRLQFLVDQGNEHLKKEMEVSLQAGEIIGQIYDEFLKQYINPDDPQTLKSLNILCVRLVFCLYAEDAGLFGEKRCMFHDYLAQFKPGRGDMRRGLIDLFDILNTPEDKRSPYTPEDLKAFPYCNGGLFSDRDIEIPFFNETLANLILKHASDDFDWSQISPTIFGAVFESTLNPETRRSGGMHYTSIENIHKVIDPLFLDDLKKELETIIAEPIEKKRIQKAREYQDKLASLKFLDPACGSGNFLTETYLSLRQLENEAMSIIGDLFNPIKVDIHQFYGIEINDFAVATATTALWIAEAQMMAKTERMLHINLDFLPLKSYNNIKEGNALRMDWNEVVPASELNYIMGNPPFVGAMWMKEEKHNEIKAIFPECEKVGEIDYVSGWYVKASMFIQGSRIRCAFVSTNSICQGQQVALIWKHLMQKYNIEIDFAYTTFRWDSEASLKAHVHCIIVGFSIKGASTAKKRLYNGTSVKLSDHINPYLVCADDVFVQSTSKQISGMSPMHMGVMARDGGFLILSEEEYIDYCVKEPQGIKFVHPYMMGREFINNIKRYCFWLVGAEPEEIKKCPLLMERMSKVREYRLNSPAVETQKFADTPGLFCQLNQPKKDFIAFPKVSSERRRYIPIGFLSKDVIVGDKIYVVEDVGLYHFGVLTSNIHNAWMRAVGGRMKSDYSYSNTIIYNSFPWPEKINAEQQNKIADTANKILEARALYPKSSFASIYDELTMPPELRKAHQENDKAVMEAYGFNWRTMSESDCVAELFKMYQKLTNNGQ